MADVMTDEMTDDKVTVASDWMAGCAGCHMSLLDIDERIVALLEKVMLTSTPITDLKHPSKDGVTVGILEGGVNNSTSEEVAKTMRERAKILIALGDCAVFGGVPTMRNAVGIDVAMQRAYVETESTVDGQILITRTWLSCSPAAPWTRWFPWTSTFPAARPVRTPSSSPSLSCWLAASRI